MKGVDLSTSAHVKRMMDVINGKRDGADVMHVCPECGGKLAEHLNAFVVVATCWACEGAGELTSDELSVYVRRSNAKASGLKIR
jgi:uncharacterized protein with PIN domain